LTANVTKLSKPLACPVGVNLATVDHITTNYMQLLAAVRQSTPTNDGFDGNGLAL